MGFILPPAQLHSGQVITQSTTISQKLYRLDNNDDSGRSAAITIKGDNITVDFRGALVEGTDPNVAPDKRVGTGILIEGNHVTLRNVAVKGFKLGVVARGCDDLKLLGCDLSYNYKQHLQSTPQAENENDWMSYHKNESDDWLRYGAGAYLDHCTKFEVKDVHVTGGQCGIMLNQCDSGTVWNCKADFLSGIGLGLYRSSNNFIAHNAFDYCVRGYSENVYNRGEDSAGILVYEQSNNNTFAYNSATHGGDGFFLWAGQTSMDIGQGGCNDNLLYGNDFSHAVANGIEATFSRNIFANNLLMDCWHGMWLGYSFDSQVIGNVFKRNVEGVSWEHGQNNQVAGNAFDQDGVGIHIWANADKRADFAYSAKKNTDSKGWQFSRNIFTDEDTAFWVADSSNVTFDHNSLTDVNTAIKLSNLDGAKSSGNVVTGIAPSWPGDDDSNVFNQRQAAEARDPKLTIKDDLNQPLSQYVRLWVAPWTSGVDGLLPDVDTVLQAELKAVMPRPLPGGNDPFLPYHSMRGRRTIHVDEWGPDDGQYPRIWVDPIVPGAFTAHLEVTGPAGYLTLVDQSGAEMQAAQTVKVPGSFLVSLKPGSHRFVSFTFKGNQARDSYGRMVNAGVEIPVKAEIPN